MSGFYRRPNVSFGPIIYQTEGKDDFEARCYGGGIICSFDIGGTCTYVKPSRKLEGQPATPDWCPMKASAIEDAREMADIRRFNLDEMTRRELLAEAKTLPDEFRPKPLTKASAHQLRRAIRRAKVAAERGYGSAA